MMMKVHALIGALLVLFASETWAVRIVTPAGDEVTVGEGDSLTLTCEDDMDAIDTWKLNGMRLEGNDDYTITTENDGKTSMLTIKQASSASQGRFVCEVDIFTNAEIRVHVEEGDQESVTIVEPDTDSKTITVGEQLNMKCTGGPGVTLLWYHRGMQVTTDSGLVVTSARDVETNKATSLLSVRKVSEEDGGNYECKDESDPLFNVDAVNIKIAADDGDNTVEMFSPSSNMLTVEPEHIISLKCRAPRNTVIVWFKDDAQLTEDDGIISVAEEGDKVISMLTVEDADEEDAGEYACVNEADESDKDYIDVQIGDDDDDDDDFCLFCGAASSTASLATILLVAMAALKLNN